MTEPVRIPSRARSKNKDKDILPPLHTLLEDLGLLPATKDTENSSSWTLTGTPHSVAVLEAGATALTKWWSAAVAAGVFGGGAILVTSLGSFWDRQATAVQVAIVAGVAAVLVGALLSIALMVVSDVRSRADGAQAVYAARRVIATEFLARSSEASTDTAAQTTSVLSESTLVRNPNPQLAPSHNGTRR